MMTTARLESWSRRANGTLMPRRSSGRRSAMSPLDDSWLGRTLSFHLGHFTLRGRLCSEFYSAVTLASGHGTVPGNRHLLRPIQGAGLNFLAGETEPCGECVQLILSVGRQPIPGIRRRPGTEPRLVLHLVSVDSHVILTHPECPVAKEGDAFIVPSPDHSVIEVGRRPGGTPSYLPVPGWSWYPGRVVTGATLGACAGATGGRCPGKLCRPGFYTV